MELSYLSHSRNRDKNSNQRRTTATATTSTNTTSGGEHDSFNQQDESTATFNFCLLSSMTATISHSVAQLLKPTDEILQTTYQLNLCGSCLGSTDLKVILQTQTAGAECGQRNNTKLHGANSWHENIDIVWTTKFSPQQHRWEWRHKNS